MGLMTKRGFCVGVFLLLGGVLTAAEVPRDLALRVNPLAGKYAKKGGTIRLNSVPPKSQNGYTDNNVYTRMTFELMYESMLGMDPMTMDVMPGLAKAWEVSEDGREFVFEMDGRARWSDGERVTAAGWNPRSSAG